MPDARIDELTALKTAYPQLELSPSDAYTATLNIPVHAAEPLKLKFTNNKISKLTHLPPLKLRVSLPKRYGFPPDVSLSSEFDWIPLSTIRECKGAAVHLWEEAKHHDILLKYVDHLHQKMDQLRFDTALPRTLQARLVQYDADIRQGQPPQIAHTSVQRAVQSLAAERSEQIRVEASIPPIPEPQLPDELGDAVEQLWSLDQFDGEHCGLEHVEIAMTRALMYRAWLAGEKIVVPTPPRLLHYKPGDRRFAKPLRGKRADCVHKVEPIITVSDDDAGVRRCVELALEDDERSWDMDMFKGPKAIAEVSWEEL